LTDASKVYPTISWSIVREVVCYLNNARRVVFVVVNF